MDYSPPGSSVHGILQARILEWVAMPFARGSSRPRDWTCISCVSCIAVGSLSTWEALCLLDITANLCPHSPICNKGTVDFFFSITCGIRIKWNWVYKSEIGKSYEFLFTYRKPGGWEIYFGERTWKANYFRVEGKWWVRLGKRRTGEEAAQRWGFRLEDSKG